ncbi:MAG: metallophosphoesterase [Clostridia bacterium]|nr:metallophosphoesterase [Clostridia bacterium]
MIPLLQINKTEIDIGLKKEYRFFQISDCHIAYIDEKSSQLDIDDNARFHRQWDKLKVDFATQFGEYYDESHNIEAHLIFEALTRYALEFNADALIMSGDIMDRVTDSNIRYLRAFIQDFPKRVIYCPGNHASHDEYGNHRNMYDRFKGLIENPEFDIFDFGEIEVVTLDNGAKQITDNQLKLLEEEIQKGRKILLVIHAPLNLGEFGEKMRKKLSGYFLLGAQGDSENAFKLLDLIKNNDKSFVAVLAGHIHTSVEYPITENLVQYTTSSGLIGYGREIIIK